MKKVLKQLLNYRQLSSLGQEEVPVQYLFADEITDVLAKLGGRYEQAVDYIIDEFNTRYVIIDFLRCSSPALTKQCVNSEFVKTILNAYVNLVIEHGGVVPEYNLETISNDTAYQIERVVARASGKNYIDAKNVLRVMFDGYRNNKVIDKIVLPLTYYNTWTNRKLPEYLKNESLEQKAKDTLSSLGNLLNIAIVGASAVGGIWIYNNFLKRRLGN